MDYRTSAEGVGTRQLTGFFDGWPSSPSPERHLALLHGSSHVVLAEEAGVIIGFVTAISDGVLAAYISLLEVRRAWRGRGVGTELVRRLLAELEGFYMVDVVCDPDLVPFYERFGMIPLAGLARRNRSVLASRPPAPQE
jgi:GNAT superfamily N-acetyltransferase